MKPTCLALLLVFGTALGSSGSAQAAVRAGDLLRCGGELTDAIALTKPSPEAPLFGPLSVQPQAQGLLRCGVAPGAVFRVIESGEDRLIVELKRGRVNMVTAEDGGADRDFDHQYFAIPKSSESLSAAGCEVLPALIK